MNTSLWDFPSHVPIVGVDEFDEARFDEFSPLIVRGAVARGSKKWTDKWLLRRFGDDPCQVSLDSRTARPAFKKRMPLGAYMDGLDQSTVDDESPQYLFHSKRDIDGASDLLQDIDVPASILNLGDPTVYRFFIGPAFSGTLPHYHTYAINALARGRKRWAIYVGDSLDENEWLLEESFRDYDSGSQARDWFMSECPRLRSRGRIQLWEFAQEARDLVYIPDRFIHTVVNLEPVVGFTVEFQPQDVRGPMPGRGPIQGRVPMRARAPMRGRGPMRGRVPMRPGGRARSGSFPP
jgi:hypothetical protein